MPITSHVRENRPAAAVRGGGGVGGGILFIEKNTIR